MANPIRGEIPFAGISVPGFEAGGILLFDANALCGLEAELGTDLENFSIAQLKSPRLFRLVIRLALEEHHGRLDDRTAGKVLHELGLTQATELITRSFMAAFPEAVAGDVADPPKAPASGTGRSSSPRGANAGSSRKPSGATPPA